MILYMVVCVIAGVGLIQLCLHIGLSKQNLVDQGRTSKVLVTEKLLQETWIKTGVAQGLVIRPLLFFRLSNEDLPNAIGVLILLPIELVATATLIKICGRSP